MSNEPIEVSTEELLTLIRQNAEQVRQLESAKRRLGELVRLARARNVSYGVLAGATGLSRSWLDELATGRQRSPRKHQANSR